MTAIQSPEVENFFFIDRTKSSFIFAFEGKTNSAGGKKTYTCNRSMPFRHASNVRTVHIPHYSDNRFAVGYAILACLRSPRVEGFFFFLLSFFYEKTRLEVSIPFHQFFAQGNEKGRGSVVSLSQPLTFKHCGRSEGKLEQRGTHSVTSRRCFMNISETPGAFQNGKVPTR